MRLLAPILLAASACAAIVGIDLGHQYTKAMMVAPGISFDVVFTDEGKRKDLSVVSLKPRIEDNDLKDAERIYGSQTGSLCLRFPFSCAANFKSLLGRSVEDEAARNYLLRHPGATLEGHDSRSDSVQFVLGTGDHVASFHVEELVAMYLGNLRERVLRVLEHHPQAKTAADDVAISVAPYADQITRLAYKDSLHLSNFTTVLGLVDEGTAVALAYVLSLNFDPEDYDNVTVHEIVFDVGAGSTSATLFSYTPLPSKKIELTIEAVAYDTSFGGEFLTGVVHEIIYLKFLAQFGFDESTVLPPRVASRLLETAEKAKTILSANSDYHVSLESLYEDSDFKCVVTREEFEAAAAPYVGRATKPVQEVLTSGNITSEQIKAVILNGGATRTPLIQKELAELINGEDKIAKVVNADEACALGTTMRAYHLKMINSNPSLVILKDRVFSNFLVSTNTTLEETPVFQVGDFTGSLSELNLGKVSAGDVEITLYENGVAYGTYSGSVSKKNNSLPCGKDADIIAKFEVDESKIFGLKTLSLRCPASVKSTSEEQQTLSLSANDTLEFNADDLKAKVKKPKSSVKIPVLPLNFVSSRPLHAVEKKTITKKLSDLRDRDLEKVKFEENKNLLESACYGLRSFIDDNLDVLLLEFEESDLEKFKTTAAEVVEWVEYDADESSGEEVEAKMAEINEHKKTVESITRMADADLSKDGCRKIYEEGSEISLQVQDILLEYGKQINMLRTQYEEEGFDFDKQNQRAIRLIHGMKEEDATRLDQNYKKFRDGLEALSDLIGLSEKKYRNLRRKEIFEKQEVVLLLIMEMMTDVVDLQKSQEKRIDYLLDKHSKLQERKEQRELRQKLKDVESEVAEPESEPVAEEDNTEAAKSPASTQTEASESTDPAASVETETPESATEAETATGEVHDEL